MSTDTLISHELVERFNHAAGLAREGDFEGSLEAWDRLLEPTDGDPLQARVITGDFLGQAFMRKAWVLMDLGRHEQARKVFEEPVLGACLGQFSLENLYEYFFSYANTLGNLQQVEGMDVAFSKALKIACDELGDYTRAFHCWNNLLAWGEQAGAWEYILREAPTAIGLAINSGDPVLQRIGQLHRAHALARTGGKTEARAIVEPMKEYARRKDLRNMVERCEQILRACE